MDGCSRREFIRAAGFGLGWLMAPRFSPARGVSKRRPNIVFILADDMGWMDSTVYGSRYYRTPNLERLARRGMLFTEAYAASPLCSPTRASIMTGKYPARLGITTPACHLPPRPKDAPILAGKARPSLKMICPESRRFLPLEEYTIGEAFKDAGYATGHFGKWHLGHPPFSPLEQGFDVDVPHWPGPGPAGSYVAPWRFPDFDPDTPNEHI
ncbi:MAG: sulfatase-like hydrolase/transferase, partial [Phycisphaerales bacterium]